jgi:hypothetical protein
MIHTASYEAKVMRFVKRGTMAYSTTAYNNIVQKLCPTNQQQFETETETENYPTLLNNPSIHPSIHPSNLLQ